MGDIIEQIKDVVVNGKHKEIEGLVRAAIDEKVDLNAIINDGLIAAMDIVGKKFGYRGNLCPGNARFRNHHEEGSGNN